MCFNVGLLLKAKDCDRVFVSGDPVNAVDPWGLVIDNRKGKRPVFYKGEHDNDVHEVKDGKKYDGYHDGVIEPSTGDVYKTRGQDSWKRLWYQDGVWFDENGYIHDVCASVGSGKEGEKFRKRNKDWEPLFKKSDEIKKGIRDTRDQQHY